MSSKPDLSSASPVSLYRTFRYPIIVVVLLAVAVGIVALTTSHLDRAIPAVALMAGCLLGEVFLVLWLLRANLPRWIRAVGLVVTIGPAAALLVFCEVEDVRVSGSMWPQLRWRFGPRHADILDEYHKDAVHTSVPASFNLSGKRSTDFAEYRGAKRDGVILGPDLLRDWSTPPRLLWKHPIGGGHSSFAVVDKALYTLEQRRDKEAITCYDADTGKQYWAFAYPALFDERMGDKGPRSTPTVVDAKVYAFGGTGLLTCLDARTGAVVWGPINVLEGNSNVTWGMSGSPLVLDDLLLVNAGKQQATAKYGTLIAFDRKTGNALWSAGSATAGYSSPQLAKLRGTTQVLLFDGRGIAGYDPATQGKELWRFKWPTNQDINVAQPLVFSDNRVFIASGYMRGSAMLQILESNGQWQVVELWRSRDMRCKFTSPVAYQGYIYGLDDGTLTCLDAQSGEVMWHGKEYQHGQLLLCKDLLVVESEKGQLALVEANPHEFRELGSFQALEHRRSWNPPAMANGHIYLRNNVEMAAYDLTGK